MIRKTLILIAVLLGLASIALADYQGLPDQVKSKLSAIQKYSKASSILLWKSEKFQMQANGTQVHEVHSFRYLPDEASRDNWGDPLLPYIEGEQKLEVIASSCYTKDGRKVDSTPKNAFNPMIPENLQFAPQLNRFREMVVTMLGLENGCIVELHYRLTMEKPLYPWMYGHVYFRTNDPVVSSELIVEMPVGEKLNFKVGGGMAEPKVTGSIYTWTTNDIAGYLSDDLGEGRELLPNVAFTTAGDWQEIQTELKAKLDNSEQGALEIPASLVEAVAGKEEPESKLQAIKGWIKERFNVLAFDHPDFAVSLRSTKDILNSGYGNSLELATLVDKLAKQMDLTTAVMLKYNCDAPVPYLSNVEGALIEFRTSEMYFICDPVLPRNELTQADLVGKTLMPINGAGKVSVVPLLSASSNSIDLDISLTDIDKDTLTGTGVFYARGQLAPFEAIRIDGANSYLESLVKLKGFTITSAQVRELAFGVSTIDFSFTAVNALDTAGDYRVLPLCVMDVSCIAKNAPTGLLTREFPQQIRIPGEAGLHVDVKLPDDWSIVEKHADLASKQVWGEGSISSTVKDGHFVFARRIALNEKSLPVGAWTDLRHWLLGAGPRNDNHVIFCTDAKCKETTKK